MSTDQTAQAPSALSADDHSGNRTAGPGPGLSSRADANLDTALSTVTEEIGRTNTKASILLAFTGAVLAGLASLADDGLSLPTRVFGSLAVLALGVAAVFLLLVVRPRLGGTDRASFPYWARLNEDEIRASMNSDTRAAQVKVLSRIAVWKYIGLRRAVDLILTALALLDLAAICAAL